MSEGRFKCLAVALNDWHLYDGGLKAPTAKAIWLEAADAPERFAARSRDLLLRTIAAPEGSDACQRASRFFQQLIQSMPTQRPDSAVSPAQSACALLIQSLVPYLACHDDFRRERSTMLMKDVLEGVNGHQGLPPLGQVAKSLFAMMQARLRDKSGKIRRVAASVLHLMAGHVPAKLVVEEQVKVLDIEAREDVRAALVAHFVLLSPAGAELDALVQRTLDVSSKVREAVFKRLQAVPVATLSTPTRLALLRRGSQDPDSAVRDAASGLIVGWCQDVGGPLLLLRLLDVVDHTDIAMLALDILLASGTLQPLTFLEGATLDGAAGANTLRRHAAEVAAAVSAGASDASPTVAPEVALLWRVTCAAVRQQGLTKGMAAATSGPSGTIAAAEAEQANKANDVLDAFLPESAEAFIAVLRSSMQLGDYAGGPFVAAQLWRIASTCMDWTDPSGQQAAVRLLEEAMMQGSTSCGEGSGRARAALTPSVLGWIEAVVDLARAVMGTELEYCRFMLQSVRHLAERRALVAAPGAAMVETQAATGEDDLLVSGWLHCLAFLDHFLQRACTVDSWEAHDVARMLDSDGLFHGLLLPALSTVEDTHVRCQAVRCLGLYCFLPSGGRGRLPTAAWHLQGCLAPDAPVELRVAAATVLGDLAAAHGVPAVDAALQAATLTRQQQQMAAMHLAAQLQQSELNEECAADSVVALEGDGSEAGQGSAAQQTGVQAATLPSCAAGSVVAVLAEGIREGLDAVAAMDAAGGGRQHPGSLRSASAAASPLDVGALFLSMVGGAVRLLALHKLVIAAPNSQQLAMAAEPLEQLLLPWLLVAWVHPATEARGGVRSCLSQLLPVFSSASFGNKRHLSRAFMPAARLAKKSVAPTLIKDMARLMQISVAGGTGSKSSPKDDDSAVASEGQDEGQEWLAQLLLSELFVKLRHESATEARCKEYASAMVQAVLLLRFPATPSLNVLTDLAERCVQSATDFTKTMQDGIKKFRDRMAAMERPDRAGMTPEEVEQQVQSFALLVAALPPHTMGTEVVLKQARRGRSSKAAAEPHGAASQDESESAGGTRAAAAAAPRRRSTRKTAAAPLQSNDNGTSDDFVSDDGQDQRAHRPAAERQTCAAREVVAKAKPRRRLPSPPPALSSSSTSEDSSDDVPVSDRRAAGQPRFPVKRTAAAVVKQEVDIKEEPVTLGPVRRVCGRKALP